MLKKFLCVLSLSTAIMLGACGNSNSASNSASNSGSSDFPNKNIQLLVPYAAGGGTDTLARQFSEISKNKSKVSTSVLNVEGGGGAVGIQQGMNSKADGYMVTLATVELLTLPNTGLADFSYESLTPIALLNSDPATITVRANAKWNTLEEFLADSKKEKLKIGNSGTGAIWHLAAAALEKEVGTTFNHIPFEGAAPAVTALLGEHVDAVSVSPAEVISQVKSGELKVLTVMADKRAEGLDDVPTLKEQGIDLSIGTWRSLAVPKETPEEVVDVLEEQFGEVAQSDEFKEQVKKLNLGHEYKNSAETEALWKEQDEFFKELVPTLDLK